MMVADLSDATCWLSVAICWDCAAADCCRSLIWYEPAARVVLMISRLSRPPPRSPTTRRMNDVRDDVRAAASPATLRRPPAAPGRAGTGRAVTGRAVTGRPGAVRPGTMRPGTVRPGTG